MAYFAQKQGPKSPDVFSITKWLGLSSGFRSKIAIKTSEVWHMVLNLMTLSCYLDTQTDPKGLRLTFIKQDMPDYARKLRYTQRLQDL